MDAWNLEKNRWRLEMELDWNKMPIRILTAAAPLIEMIEKNKGVVKGTGCSSLVEVLRTLRQARNDFGSIMGLSAALQDIPVISMGEDGNEETANGDRDDEDDSDSDSDAQDDKEKDADAAGKKPGKPTADMVYAVMSSLIRHLRSLQIVAPWKSLRCEDLTNCFLVPGDIASHQVPHLWPDIPVFQVVNTVQHTW